MRARNTFVLTAVLALSLASSGLAERVALRAPGGLYVSAESGGGALRANARQVGRWQTFELERLSSDRIALVTDEGLYVSASSTDGALLGDRRDAGTWEAFDLVQLGRDRVALRADDRRYVSTRDDGRLYADRSSARSRETFQIVRLDNAVDDTGWQSNGQRFVALRTDNGSLVSAGEYGEQLRADQRQLGATEIFQLHELDGGRIVLQAWNGRYVSVADGRVELGGRQIGARQVFEVVPRDGDRMALRTLDERYITAEGGGGGELTARRTEARAWETFRLERVRPSSIGDHGGPPTDANGGNIRRVAIETQRGFYLTLDRSGTLRADANNIGEREAFELLEIDGEQIALRASNGRYVTAVNGGGGELRADRDRVREWETFRTVRQRRGRVALETERGNYLSAQAGGGATLRADRSSVGSDETFRWVDLGSSGYDDPRDNSSPFGDGPRDDPRDDHWTEPLRSGPSYQLSLQTQRGTYWSLEGDGRLNARGTSQGSSQIFELIPLAGDRAALRGANDRFVTVDGDRVLAVDRQLSRQAIFTVERLSDGGHAVRAWNGRYLSADEGGGGELTANRERARAWETFRLNVVSQGGTTAPPPPTGNDLRGRIALKTVKGQYLTLGNDGRLRADARSAGQRESFELVQLDGGRVALRASNGRFVTALQSSDRGLGTERGEIGRWQSFRMVTRGSGKIALMTSQGRFVSADGGGGGALAANTYEADEWETFEVVQLR